jgi:hypothetical protein
MGAGVSANLTSEVIAAAEAAVVVALLMLLVARELAAAGGPGARPLARNLTIVAAPLVVLFGVVVAHRLLVLIINAEATQPPVAASRPAAAEPAPTAQATAVSTADQSGPAAAEPPIATVIPAGPRLVLDESFAQPPPGWPETQPGTGWSGYSLAARQPSQFVAIGIPLPDLLRNVVVSAHFRKVGGPPGGGFGIIVRDQSASRLDGTFQGGSYYVLEVGDLGEVGIWRRDEDHWVDLVPWTPAAGVRTGTQPNELVASAQGDRLSLTVNGVEVASATDATPAAGRVGIFAGGDFNEVVLEHLVVQAPPD